MLVQAPQLCPGYQIGMYNITLRDDKSDTILYSFGPSKYTQENENEPELIVKRIYSELISEQNYTLEVSVESLGSRYLKQKSFSKFNIDVYNNKS